LEPHAAWAGQAQDFALEAPFAVPPGFDRSRPLALSLRLGDSGWFSHPETTVTIDGRVVASSDRHHQEVPLPPGAADGLSHQLLLTGWTGTIGAMAGDAAARLTLGPSALVEIDPATREFVALARTALQAAAYLDDLVPAQGRLLNALDAAFLRLDLREPYGDRFYDSVPPALELLRRRVAEAGPALDLEIISAGHAHIDVAWLWPLAQTRRKAARTFRTALQLMDAFPAFHFTQSQPQLYEFVRRDDPALFGAVRARVAAGRWEAIGGMWVEPDCNATGPESLARQLLLGRTFFRTHFGPQSDSPVFWGPDVFGFPWSLPQLLKQAGLDYFFTIKLAWNKNNPPPHDSFWWQGLDGSRVLAHFSTTPAPPFEGEPDMRNTATYNADLSAVAALGAWAKLKQKDDQRTLLMVYGYGDGGGGPTREMSENARELRAFPGLPRVRQGKASDFFRRLEAESGPRLPTWNGELYLEIHRGTYTTQGRTKRDNRKAEFLLHDAEFLAAWAARLDPGWRYPGETFRRAWQTVCLNQFHDILPGSSIGPVYAESRAQYAAVREEAGSVRETALAAVAAQAGGDLVVTNPSGFERADLAFWPEAPEGAGAAAAGAFEGAQTQAVEGGLLLGGLRLPPFSAIGLKGARTAGAGATGDAGLRAAPGLLENAFLRVELNAAGDIVRITDKTAGRQVLPPGAIANQWQAFEDRPLLWDAWDIDIFYEEKMWLAEPADAARVVEMGPLRAAIEIRRRILGSAYVQRISLAHNSPVLTFDTRVDWRERHTLLKAAFPVAVLAPSATYEIQWGSIQRPTHRNTSWDWARFEAPAQKWVDLSEGDYGVALLNDCKYGHDIRDNVIRISLLRSPVEPDPEADQGEHRFVYALYPHGPMQPHEIAARAWELNDPLIVRPGPGGEPRGLPSLLRGPENVIVETIKAAEDGDGIIVRLFECDRRRGRAVLEAGFEVREAWITNLLEENLERVPCNGRTVSLELRPFQIVTLRLVPARTAAS
jgi:alpha-mannosidase